MSVYSNMLCVGVILAMLAYIISQGWAFRIDRSMAFLIAFDCFCISSILWANNPALSVTIAFKTLPLLTVFCIVLWNYIACSHKQKALLKAIYYSGLILAIYTVMKQGGPGSYFAMLGGGQRIGGNVANVNTIGIAAAFSAIIAFYYVYYERKNIHLIGIVTCVTVALGTGSNKALICIASGCLMLVVAKSLFDGNIASLLKAIIVCAVVSICFITIIQLPLFEVIRDRFTRLLATITGSGITDESAIRRFLMIEAGFKQFLKTPFFGIGINNGSIIALQSAGINAYLHNNYIELLVGCGLIGAILFYLPVLTSLKKLVVCGIRGDSFKLAILVLMLAWFILQWGYVCYFEKVTYVYIALASTAVLSDWNDKQAGSSRPKSYS